MFLQNLQVIPGNHALPPSVSQNWSKHLSPLDYYYSALLRKQSQCHRGHFSPSLRSKKIKGFKISKQYKKKWRKINTKETQKVSNQTNRHAAYSIILFILSDRHLVQRLPTFGEANERPTINTTSSKTAFPHFNSKSSFDPWSCVRGELCPSIPSVTVPSSFRLYLHL